MTPTALTPAAQKAAAKRAAAIEPGGSHPRRVRRPTGPSAPRRVSGPVNRSGAPPAGSRTRASARPEPKAARPSRSRSRLGRRLGATNAALAAVGPALAHALPRPRRSSGPIGARLAAGVRTMPNHRLIDRLVRGQAWIPVLGVMLAGIVFMQVEVLKLGAGIGRSVQQASTLSTLNQQLRASVATLGDDQRIESMAAQMGMIMPPPTAVGFLSAASNTNRAVGSISAPSVTGFLTATSHNGSVALANDLAATGGSKVGAIAIAPAPGTTGSATSPSLPSPTSAAAITPSSTASAPTTTAPATTGTSTPTGTPTGTGTPIGTASTPVATSPPATSSPPTTSPASSSGGVQLPAGSQSNGG